MLTMDTHKYTNLQLVTKVMKIYIRNSKNHSSMLTVYCSVLHAPQNPYIVGLFCFVLFCIYYEMAKPQVSCSHSPTVREAAILVWYGHLLMSACESPKALLGLGACFPRKIMCSEIASKAMLRPK